MSMHAPVSIPKALASCWGLRVLPVAHVQEARMQEQPLFQVVGIRTEERPVILSRHAPREAAEQIARMLDAEGYRQIRIEAEDEYENRQWAA